MRAEGERVDGVWLEKFYAVFQPARRDDLREGAEAFIGREGLWQRVWIIEEGTYAGEWACALLEPRSTSIAWAPDSDLRPLHNDVAAPQVAAPGGEDTPSGYTGAQRLLPRVTGAAQIERIADPTAPQPPLARDPEWSVQDGC